MWTMIVFNGKTTTKPDSTFLRWSCDNDFRNNYLFLIYVDAEKSLSNHWEIEYLGHRSKVKVIATFKLQGCSHCGVDGQCSW